MPADKKGAPSDVLALDVESDGIYAVRMKRGREGPIMDAAARLPALNGADDTGTITAPEGKGGGKLTLPKAFRARSVAVTIPATHGVLRLVTFREPIERASVWEKRVRENLGVNSSFQVGFVTGSSSGKGRDMALAVALPREEITSTLAHLGGGGRQIVSLEVSGLAAMNSFLYGPGRQLDKPAAVVVSSGQVTILGIVSNARIHLMRKFALGRDAIVRRIAEDMHLEQDTATQLFTDPTFDISGILDQVIGPFASQLTISREFVERHEDCRLERLYVGGSMSQSTYWLKCLRDKVGLEPVGWDPFEGLSVKGSIDKGEKDRDAPLYSAAVGAALGALEVL